MKSTIYTGGGDKGETSLLGGRRVPKYALRIEAYGTIDELMAHTALLRDKTSDEELREDLLTILDRLMSLASIIAADGIKLPENMPEVGEEDIQFLEKRMDDMDAELPKLTSFILPGGHESASHAHIARTICRRAERILWRLHKDDALDPLVIKYFNRLSDYYFLLSRKLCLINNVREIPWKP